MLACKHLLGFPPAKQDRGKEGRSSFHLTRMPRSGKCSKGVGQSWPLEAWPGLSQVGHQRGFSPQQQPYCRTHGLAKRVLSLLLSRCTPEGSWPGKGYLPLCEKLHTGVGGYMWTREGRCPLLNQTMVGPPGSGLATLALPGLLRFMRSFTTSPSTWKRTQQFLSAGCVHLVVFKVLVDTYKTRVLEQPSPRMFRSTWEVVSQGLAHG